MATRWPSVNCTRSRAPSSRARTVTVLNGVTVPSARICTSMVSRRTGTAWTGVRRFASRGPKNASRCGGGVAGPPQYQTAAAPSARSTIPRIQWRKRERGGVADEVVAVEGKSGLLIDDDA